MPDYIPQTMVPSTNARTEERSRPVFKTFELQMRSAIGTYFAAEPGGTQVTLAVLNAIGLPAVRNFALEHRTTLDRTKQDLGLAVPILLARLAGAENVATYRDGRRPSTRTRSQSWPSLNWVSRYTPHRVTDEGLRRIRRALSCKAGEVEDLDVRVHDDAHVARHAPGLRGRASPNLASK